MKQFLLFLSVLIVIAVGLLVYAGRGRGAAVRQPRTDLVYGSDGLYYVIECRDLPIVVMAPKEWDNISSRTSSNPDLYSLDADVDLFASGGAPRLNIKFNSNSPSLLMIDSRRFNLSAGRIFLVEQGPEGAAEKKIVQEPFAPLNVTPKYLSKLRAELKP